MAKKNLNPADSFRKAQRKKELKKNKTERSKARDFALVKKDTWELQDEIARLEADNDTSESARLADLRAELEKINRKKAEYVAEHPEQRRLVYRPRRKVDDDDIPMPAGPPPGTEEVDSDDDIPMPEDPPPGQLEQASTSSLPPLPSTIPLPSRPPPMMFGLPPPPPGFPSGIPPPPPPPLGYLGGTHPLPPPPPGFMGTGLPPPPPGFPQMPMHGYAPQHALPNFPPPGLPLPPPPPGFFPRRSQSASSMQDPLSTIPHQTFQTHRAGQSTLPSHPSLPPNPTKGVAGPVSSGQKGDMEKPSAELLAATVFAAPQLRDFKKEATAFVPTALKRKRPGAAGSGSSSKINAAPSDLGGDAEVEVESPARPDLLSALKGQFGPAPPVSNPMATKEKIESKPKKAKNNDYEKFVEEIGDILGPAK